LKYNIWEQLSEQVVQSSWINSVRKLISILETEPVGSEVLDILISQTFGNIEEAKIETSKEFVINIPIINNGQVVRFFNKNDKVLVQLTAPEYFLEGEANTSGLAMAVLLVKVLAMQFILKLLPDKVDIDIKTWQM